MNVKVLVRAPVGYALSQGNDVSDKVEYFNNIEYWTTDGRYLELYSFRGKDRKTEPSVKVATIAEWAWIKED